MFVFRLSARVVISLLALALTALLGVAAFGMAALAAYVWIIQRPVLLNATAVPCWPNFLPPCKIPVELAWWYIGGAGAVLLFCVPLTLAVLERLYIVLGRRNEKAPSEPADDSGTASGGFPAGEE